MSNVQIETKQHYNIAKMSQFQLQEMQNGFQRRESEMPPYIFIN